MLSRLKNMFRVADLRNKIIFTILMVGVYRIGTHVPVPYVDFAQIQKLQSTSNNAGVVGFLDLFSGGAITSVSVFFLGIMPYITASIIMQLLGVVIPKLEEWQQEGQSGQKKITQWTRYLTVGLALIQSTGFVFALKEGKQGLLGFAGFTGTNMIPGFNAARASLIIMTWVAGTALVMWIGELITQRGVGNGMSILIFASVVSRLPAQGGAIFTSGGWFKGVVICAIGVGMIVAIVFVESGQRRIPVQFAKRVVGRRMYGGQSTYIPLKVNQSGVIPVIFASSILAFPALIATATNWKGSAVVRQRQHHQPEEPRLHGHLHVAHHLLRVLLHGHRVQPGAAGRHHPQAGWLHPRHPAGPRDREVPGQGAEPHHVAGLALPGRDRR